MHRKSKAPFTFIVNIMVPANPNFSLIMSWAADAEQAEPTLNRQVPFTPFPFSDHTQYLYEQPATAAVRAMGATAGMLPVTGPLP